MQNMYISRWDRYVLVSEHVGGEYKEYCYFSL